MTDLLTRTTRAFAATALIGALAAAPAYATDWGQLKGSDWSGQQQAAAEGNAKTGGDAATGAPAAGNGMGAQIASAFQQLGMAAPRAECYGDILTKQLPPEAQQQAAEIVQGATNGQEVREAVLNAGPTMVGGFSAADGACPESMGG